ncbi:MAG: hypothetical protein HY903_23480 [Deltaproteobacteria bacterium]|nr:hypothetical protein [Deltaproteobacteria bacterium]
MRIILKGSVLMLGALLGSCATDSPSDGPAATSPSGAYLELRGADGSGGLAVGADGLVRAGLYVGHVVDMRTIGVRVQIEGARLVEWQRVDGWLTSNGGQVLQLAGGPSDSGLELTLATTRAVSAPDKAALLATLTLRPTAAAALLSLDVSGPNRGVIAASGRRFDVTTLGATF